MGISRRPAAEAAADEAPAKKVASKSAYDVNLKAYPADIKIKLIKELRGVGAPSRVEAYQKAIELRPGNFGAVLRVFDSALTVAAAIAAADEIGYPVLVKASAGGGGRGMRPIHGEDELEEKVNEGRREAEAAFGNGEGYLEKMILRARHVEVQILGDKHGEIYHLFERDCSVQRRNQKVFR